MRPFLRILTDLVSSVSEAKGPTIVDLPQELAEFEVAADVAAQDAIECGHPRGPTRCLRLIACTACPFAVVFEIEPEQAA